MIKLTARQVYESFKAANLPCYNEIEYNEETDENNQLGRPGCYTSKVNFNDRRLDEEDSESCKIEAFDNMEDAEARKEYVERVIRENPTLLKKQYMYLKGFVLVRIPFKLAPKYVKGYEQVLDALLEGRDVTNMFEPFVELPGKAADNSAEMPDETEVKVTYTITFEDKEEQAPENAPEVNEPIIPDFTERFQLEDFSYCVPAGWLSNITQKGNYHYAKQLQKLDGGYIYCTINAVTGYKEKKALKDNPADVLSQVFEGMKKGFVGLGGIPKKATLAGLPTIKYYANVKLSGDNHLCGGLLTAGVSRIYSLMFVMPNYRIEDYESFIEKFVSQTRLNTDIQKSSPLGSLLSKFKK
ncbi:MAG: hypothetical protein GX061_05735 [Eubacteriaceae bacterium]|nr:hypothetical protein [Eubacteriaceae bacterium]